MATKHFKGPKKIRALDDVDRVIDELTLGLDVADAFVELVRYYTEAEPYVNAMSLWLQKNAPALGEDGVVDVAQPGEIRERAVSIALYAVGDKLNQLRAIVAEHAKLGTPID